MFSAVTLIEKGSARPLHGDILTFAVYAPGYEYRQERDWVASPYNFIHRNSVYVFGKFPYDPTFIRDKQNTSKKSDPGISQIRATKQRPPSTSEADIDHEILMRSTAEDGFDGGYSKRPRWPDSYMLQVMRTPNRIVQTAPWVPERITPSRANPLRHVLTKLLLVRDPEALLLYMSTGVWPGKKFWTDPFTLPDPEEPRPMPPEIIDAAEADWFASVSPPSSMHSDWKMAPSVDRTRVKLKRVDYFGHSGPEALYLLYGTQNAKGELPGGEITIEGEAVADFRGLSLLRVP